MVATVRPRYPTVISRLDHVREVTKVPSKADFARWIKAKNPQTVSQAEGRDRLSRDLAIQISEATGASLDWLLQDRGDPFPSGVKNYPGAVPSSAEYRLRAAEDQIDAISTVMVVCLRLMAEKLPVLAPDLVAALAALPGETGSKRQLLEAAAGAAALGLRSVEQAVPPVARRGSPGKPQRTDR
jgi:hypothetical protein